MKFLTHNSLRCNAKDVALGYPLLIDVQDMEILETEFNKQFIQGILSSLNWKGVLIAADSIGLTGLPLDPDIDLVSQDESLLLALHKLLLDVNVISGFLICPESGRRFPISEGIPNMMCVSFVFLSINSILRLA
jgi:multifunctional methyltransferase subunit TRM112